jgi:phosphatidylethanolamine/phosphatidyl-N-methylethanolamine N-methyltransferase
MANLQSNPAPKPARTSRGWYNGLAGLYDPLIGLLEGPVFKKWRKRLGMAIQGKAILEVGVGTGRSIPFYPPEGQITAIDFSSGMLKKAQKKAEKQKLRVHLALMDVQNLAFPDATFDTVVSSLVFCEVADPLRGLREVKRVLRSGGKLVMLEHVISDKPAQAKLMELLSPPLAAVTGENFNRDTAYNVEKSGFKIERVTRLSSIFRLIEARKEMIYMLK